MSDILLIRHAETDMAGTFCGRCDPELNARGLLQLPDLVDKLRKKKIDAVYTSDLRRAHATGRAIAEAFGVDCRLRPRLREIDFGRWDGLTWKEIEHRERTYAYRWVAEYPNLPAPEGEIFQDFERRVLEEIEFLSTNIECSNQNLAIVTHAGVIRTVLRALHGCSDEDSWNQTKSYCSIVGINRGSSSSHKITEVHL